MIVQKESKQVRLSSWLLVSRDMKKKHKTKGQSANNHRRSQKNKK